MWGKCASDLVTCASDVGKVTGCGPHRVEEVQQMDTAVHKTRQGSPETGSWSEAIEHGPSRLAPMKAYVDEGVDGVRPMDADHTRNSRCHQTIVAGQRELSSAPASLHRCMLTLMRVWKRSDQ